MEKYTLRDEREPQVGRDKSETRRKDDWDFTKGPEIWSAITSGTGKLRQY
jgi:hypothetical protein